MVAPITEERRAADIEAEAQANAQREPDPANGVGLVDDSATATNARA
jgi:hypothetical protein